MGLLPIHRAPSLRLSVARRLLMSSTRSVPIRRLEKKRARFLWLPHLNNPKNETHPYAALMAASERHLLHLEWWVSQNIENKPLYRVVSKGQSQKGCFHFQSGCVVVGCVVGWGYAGRLCKVSCTACKPRFCSRKAAATLHSCT